MAELYQVLLGSYTFDALPNVAIRSSAVIRPNAAPNVRVAVNYEFRLKCRIRATTDALGTVPPSAATVLGTFLATIHSRTLPTSLSIKDSAGNAIPEIGSITSSGGWEDLQVVDFDLPDAGEQVGQMMAGAWFTITFRARKALADGNGICELDQVYEDDTDDTGAAVRRLSCKIRISQAAYDNGARVGGSSATAAISAKLALACPPGWGRTRGNNGWGFAARYPLYEQGGQVGLEAETVSEVRSSSGVVGASGATKSEVTTRIKEDPEKGLLRTTVTADTVGPESSTGLDWVISEQPPESTGETLEEVNARHARGEWETRAALQSAKGTVRRVARRYATRGGTRSAGAIVMAGGYLPVVTLGPFSELRLVETIEIYSQGAQARLADVPVPKPLDEPWVQDGEVAEDSLPSVDEHASYATQRLWLRTVTRQYLWRGPGDALANAQLVARVMSDAGSSLAVLEVAP